MARSRLHTTLFSLQAKLVVAMTALIVLAVLATGAIFVLRTKGDRQRQALEQVAATAPLIYSTMPYNGGPSSNGLFFGTTDVAPAPGAFGYAMQGGQVDANLDKISELRDVRILLVGDQNVVAYDTGGGLQGFRISYPAADPDSLKRGFLSWQPSTPAGNLTFVAPAGPSLSFTTTTALAPTQTKAAASAETTPHDAGATEAPTGTGNTTTSGIPMTTVSPAAGVAIGPEPNVSGQTVPQPGHFNVVLAVPSGKIQNAWLSALPGVGIAGGIALPLAILAALVIARQVTRPIRQLTLASEAMARGDFDQRVEVTRSDEVGRLAKAFSTMAERVGDRDLQMRTLVANVSHDLKTPMTSIMGYAQAMQDGLIEPERLPQVARVIQEQAAHTNTLISDLLFLSEVDAGQTLPSHHDVPAAQLASGAITLLQAVADKKGVSIALDANGSICAAVDPEKLTRALANLLDNAIRFSPVSSTVTVTTQADGEEVQIEVRNQGPHIPEDELPYLFERFFRGAADPSGHGLGLAIAQEAVELSGGRIEARNTEEGVAFTISLHSTA